MDAEFEARKRRMLDECRVSPEVFDDMLPRLEKFMTLFLNLLTRREQKEHAQTFVRGLLSDLEHKNTESIAYRFGEERMPLQWFIGVSHWDDKPLRNELVREVGVELGSPDGVIVFDPSAHPKSGRESVGVNRQWCGRLGKVENCQVGIYMGYVSHEEHALVDMRLFLPKDWAEDRQRCRKAGVPNNVGYQSRHRLCLDMLAQNGSKLPHSWVTGDDELGRPYWFRRRLHKLGEHYLLSVPSVSLIRDLESAPPIGKRGQTLLRPWKRVEEWTASLAEKAWTRIDVRDGSKGPLIVEIVKRRVKARTDKKREGHDETLAVIRYRDRDNNNVVKTDYYLSNADAETSLAEFARVAKAEHRIEECLQRAKSEAGLGDYEARTWKGWHHHQTLSLIATWFLVKDTRRGKKIHTGIDRPTSASSHRRDAASPLRQRHAGAHRPPSPKTPRAQRTRPRLSLDKTQTLATIECE